MSGYSSFNLLHSWDVMSGQPALSCVWFLAEVKETMIIDAIIAIIAIMTINSSMVNPFIIVILVVYG